MNEKIVYSRREYGFHLENNDLDGLVTVGGSLGGNSADSDGGVFTYEYNIFKIIFIFSHTQKFTMIKKKVCNKKYSRVEMICWNP